VFKEYTCRAVTPMDFRHPSGVDFSQMVEGTILTESEMIEEMGRIVCAVPENVSVSRIGTKWEVRNRVGNPDHPNFDETVVEAQFDVRKHFMVVTSNIVPGHQRFLKGENWQIASSLTPDGPNAAQ
jgi:hypothetical protein